MSTCRRVRWKGRTPMRRRVDTSSSTTLARPAKNQRSAGSSSLSYAAQAASTPAAIASHSGIVTTLLSSLPRGSLTRAAAALAVEQVAAAGDHDDGADDYRGVRHVAEHDIAEQDHPDDLLVE